MKLRHAFVLATEIELVLRPGRIIELPLPFDGNHGDQIDGPPFEDIHVDQSVPINGKRACGGGRKRCRCRKGQNRCEERKLIE